MKPGEEYTLAALKLSAEFGMSDTDLPRLKARLEKILAFQKPQIEGDTLLRFGPAREIIIVGDLAGDAKSLERVLEHSGALAKLSASPNVFFVALGDFIDRADTAREQFLCLEMLLAMQEQFRGQVVLVKGNHEAHSPGFVSPYSFGGDCLNFYGQAMSRSAELAWWDFLKKLPLTALGGTVAGQKYFFVHAGIPPGRPIAIRDLRDGLMGDPDDQGSPAFAMLWADYGKVHRTGGVAYSDEDWQKFKESNNIDGMFVGHVPVAGGVEKLSDGLWRVHTANNEAYRDRQENSSGYAAVDGSTGAVEIFSLKG